MKRASMILLAILIMSCLLVFAACPEKEPEVEKEKITTLVGDWRQIPEKGAVNDYYEVKITETEIEVYLVEQYRDPVCTWKGTYQDPAEPCEEYTFVSTEIGHESSTRNFTYSDGLLRTKLLEGIGERWITDKDYIDLQKVTEIN